MTTKYYIGSPEHAPRFACDLAEIAYNMEYSGPTVKDHLVVLQNDEILQNSKLDNMETICQLVTLFESSPVTCHIIIFCLTYHAVDDGRLNLVPELLKLVLKYGVSLKAERWYHVLYNISRKNYAAALKCFLDAGVEVSDEEMVIYMGTAIEADALETLKVWEQQIKGPRDKYYRKNLCRVFETLIHLDCGAVMEWCVQNKTYCDVFNCWSDTADFTQRIIAEAAGYGCINAVIRMLKFHPEGKGINRHMRFYFVNESNWPQETWCDLNLKAENLIAELNSIMELGVGQSVLVGICYPTVENQLSRHPTHMAVKHEIAFDVGKLARLNSKLQHRVQQIIQDFKTIGYNDTLFYIRLARIGLRWMREYHGAT